MKNHLVHKVSLKCDAAGCGHEEAVDAITASFIGKPCPKCGASLLTEQDFKSGELMREVLDALAALVPESEVIKPSADDLLIGINPHGGKLTLSLMRKRGP